MVVCMQQILRRIILHHYTAYKQSNEFNELSLSFILKCVEVCMYFIMCVYDALLQYTLFRLK